jgi:hypothetical protein
MSQRVIAAAAAYPETKMAIVERNFSRFPGLMATR